MSVTRNNGIPISGFRAISVPQFLVNGGGSLIVVDAAINTIVPPVNSVGATIQARTDIGDEAGFLYLAFGANPDAAIAGYKMSNGQFYYAGQTPFTPGGDPGEITQGLGDLRSFSETASGIGGYFNIQWWRLA